jgi:hypothetical protein
VYLRGYVDAMLSMNFAQRRAGGAKMDFSPTGLSSHNFGFEQNLDLVRRFRSIERAVQGINPVITVDWPYNVKALKSPVAIVIRSLIIDICPCNYRVFRELGLS